MKEIKDFMDMLDMHYEHWRKKLDNDSMEEAPLDILKGDIATDALFYIFQTPEYVALKTLIDCQDILHERPLKEPEEKKIYFCEADMKNPGYLCKYCGLDAGRFGQMSCIPCPAMPLPNVYDSPAMCMCPHPTDCHKLGQTSCRITRDVMEKELEPVSYKEAQQAENQRLTDIMEKLVLNPKVTMPIAPEEKPYCAGENCNATKENITHSVECMFEHFLAYTGDSAATPLFKAQLKRAYLHGRDSAKPKEEKKEPKKQTLMDYIYSNN